MRAVTLARKPPEMTIVDGALTYSCGGLNINECRIETTDAIQAQTGHRGQHFGTRERSTTPRIYQNYGRWPANVVLDRGISEEIGSNGYKCLSDFFRIVIQ